jgi:hypothetical protein
LEVYSYVLAVALPLTCVIIARVHYGTVLDVEGSVEGCVLDLSQAVEEDGCCV